MPHVMQRFNVFSFQSTWFIHFSEILKKEITRANFSKAKGTLENCPWLALSYSNVNLYMDNPFDQCVCLFHSQQDLRARATSILRALVILCARSHHFPEEQGITLMGVRWDKSMHTLTNPTSHIIEHILHSMYFEATR